MAQLICKASYKTQGKKKETLVCQRMAKYTSADGNPCCGYHKKGTFIIPQKKEKDEPIECSICYDEYNNENDCYTTACNHTFHKKCMQSWAETKMSLSCPMCRTKLSKHPFICKQYTVKEVWDEVATATRLTPEERIILGRIIRNDIITNNFVRNEITTIRGNQLLNATNKIFWIYVDKIILKQGHLEFTWFREEARLNDDY